MVDFAKLVTEQRNSRTADLDILSTIDLVSRLNAEDHAVPEAVGRAKYEIAKAIDLIADRMRQGGRLFFVGAGTSGRLGVIEAAECPPTFGTPPSLVQAVMCGGKSAVFKNVEGAEDRGRPTLKVKPMDSVVGIAASGVTPFVTAALTAAKKRGAATILITCNRIEAPAHVITIDVGPEVIAGSTRLKAATATKLVLNTITVGVMTKLGKIYENLMVDVQPTNAKLRARALRLVQLLTGAKTAAARRALRCGSVKTAVVMLQKGVGPRQAEDLLARAGGFLRGALL